MRRKMILWSSLTVLLLLTFYLLSRSGAQSPSAQGWQVEDKGGYYSESNGVFQLVTNGGDDPGIAIYKEIHPIGDFSFSIQVKANVMESCAIYVRGYLPVHSATCNDFGFNFEYGHYGTPVFLFVRTCGSWTASQVAYSSSIEWYTMQFTVCASPFTVEVSVLDENNTLLGTSSFSDFTNLKFEDIKYMGFYIWGNSLGDYLFRNIKSTLDNPTSISINTQSSSTTVGAVVNFFGTLADSNSSLLQNRTVVLSYTVEGANTWIPISSGRTDENGEYSIQWVNSASGTFTLKTEWDGDSNYSGASNTTTLSFLPYINKTVFLIESNSTVTALAFNNETSTLHFNVTGPPATTGYTTVTIAKTLLTDSENLHAEIDGKQLNYTVTSTSDSWVFLFSYSHSTHQISMSITASAPVTQPATDYLIIATILAILSTAIAFITRFLLRSGKQTRIIQSPSKLVAIS